MRKLLLIVVLSSLSLVACNKERNARKNNIIPPTELTDIVAKRSVSRIWTRSTGDGEGRLGLRQGPAAAGGMVYVADVEDGLRAMNAETGGVQWSANASSGISSSPGVGEGLVVVGTLEGEALAFEVDTGAQRWSSQLSAEILSAPVVSRGIVIVRGNDGRIHGLDANTGTQLWQYDRTTPTLTLRGNSPVIADAGLVFAGFDDGHLVALRLEDGGLVWDQAVAVGEGRTDLDRMVDIDGRLASTGSEVYAATYQGQIAAVTSESGRPLWARPQSSYTGIALVGDEVITVDSEGNVWGLDRRSGTSLWKQDKLAHRWLSGPAQQGNTVLVGDLEGYVHWIDVDSGELVARERFGKEPIRATPVVSDGIAFVQTTDGELAAYRINNL
ncbi:MAG: outer membrane protein assembly factor BamB [Xanthomonadales bacterium]|nr:outer membrane protein assembly factor BamB [Xanthomonadales bacterium]